MLAAVYTWTTTLLLLIQLFDTFPGNAALRSPGVAKSSAAAGKHPPKHPNFVLLMADDLGIGDVGCFGNDTIRTPHIDSIAAYGAKLVHHIAADSMCTPSRAAFLTGRYPIRSGMVSDKFRVLPYPSCSGGLPRNETTFAEILRDVGYSTALIGKWHQGLNRRSWSDHHYHPLNQGFDYFYGLPHGNLRDCDPEDESETVVRRVPYIYRHILLVALLGLTTLLILKEMGLLSWNVVIALSVVIVIVTSCFIGLVRSIGVFNCVLMRDHEVIEQPVQLKTLASRFTREAINFITQNQNRSFLLFVAYVHPHSALITSDKFQGRSKHGRYGDCVEEMDWSVGQILATLRKLGLHDDTFVYFTSDHGGEVELHNEGGWNGIYKGGKGQPTEGGIRVPAAIRYSRSVKPGTIIAEPTSLMDILPTITSLAGSRPPNNCVIDGKDILQLLTGREKVSPHKFMFHYCGKDIHAVRYRPRFGNTTYKAYYATPRWTPGTHGCSETFTCLCSKARRHDPPLLYNLSLDPSEDHPLDTSDIKYMEIINRIRDAKTEHQRTVIPVEDQLSWTRVLPKPWLQPFCGLPPLLTCKENTMP
ncbi:arylsulfatase H-like [Ptychodera flava]|uniref:arylsulfatase H-like n=1 Tax=Ptychodera flava TaxID=63121 RepID=UPI003969F9CB